MAITDRQTVTDGSSSSLSVSFSLLIAILRSYPRLHGHQLVAVVLVLESQRRSGVCTAASWRGVITGSLTGALRGAFTLVLSSPSIGRVSFVGPLRQGAEVRVPLHDPCY
jgi:hypothetical protein